MHSEFVFALAVGIGIVAGLRSLTAPALVSWAAHLGWLDLHGSKRFDQLRNLEAAIMSGRVEHRCIWPRGQYHRAAWRQ